MSAPGTTTSGLLVDLYELTMMQAYHRWGMKGTATFDLFVRRLPRLRNFLVAAGIGTVLEILEKLRFTSDDLDYLASTGLFRDDFLDELSRFRFTGDVEALPEGTVFFPPEPVLRITAPLPEAQFVETLVMNQIHLQTMLASKAARVVLAARGRDVVDFGLRRMHGADAGLLGGRAYWIAGVAATSNVLAGQRFGIPVTGTMAHSFVQAHDDELEAMRRFAAVYPETVLLVDTYDTIGGIDRVIALARELGPDCRLRGIRLDSGDLAGLAMAAREKLDAAGLTAMKIFASGNLDEYRIIELLADSAPIDAFGVGTRMGTSADAPSLDLAYKLAELDGLGRLKLTSNKDTWPGRKQVWRERDTGGVFARDTIGLEGETDRPGEPLLVPVMRGGRRLEAASEPLDAARERAARQIAALPAVLRSLEPADPPYAVTVSPALRRLREAVIERLQKHRNGDE